MARAAPKALPAHGQLGCNIWLSDRTDNPPALQDNEALDLRGKRVRRLNTPHVPHNWDASLIYEETTGTLFTSALFTQTGPADPITESHIVASAIVIACRSRRRHRWRSRRYAGWSR